jgi:hypothetical protein
MTTAVVLAWLAATGAQAATYNMQTTNTQANGFTWVSPQSWTSGAAPSADHDYVVQSASFQLRSAGGTFGGKSLTVRAGGAMVFTVSPTVGDLRLEDGGYIVNNQDSQTRTISGGLSFTTAGASPSYTNYIRTGGNTNAARHLIFESTTAGAGTVQLAQRGTITFNGDSSFAGTWASGGLGLTLPGVTGSYDHTATLFTNVVAGGTDSLGDAASFAVGAFSTLDVNYDWSTSGALTLQRDAAQTNANAPMILDQAIEVGALTIGGDSLSAGTYTFAELNSDYDLFFRDGGSGSITVVPEPSLAALAGIACVLVTMRRRRIP